LESYSTIAADWYRSVRFQDLPPDIVTQTERGILNTIAVALAASALEYGPPVRHAARALGGTGPANIIGFGDFTSTASAAFANATMVASLAYDDSHVETLIHVYGTVVSLALSLAQERHCDGQEVLTAIAGAAELICRLGVVAPTAFHRQGFHPTGIIGAVGAAYAAARLIGLNRQQTIDAVGIVGNMASGINQCWVDGTWSQLVDNGWAAQAGITAATLAQYGYTGPAEVLEGPLGLFHTHIQAKGHRFDFARMVADFGRHWESRHIELKPYPCGHVSQPFVDCALALYREGLRAADVEHVTCFIADWMVPVVCEPIARKRRPATAWHGRVSLPYTIAEALHFGRLDATSYRPENLGDAELLQLVDRIHYEVDDSAKSGRHYKGWIRVRTRDGRVLEKVKSAETGANQPMNEEQFKGKIAGCIQLARPVRSYQAIADAVASLRQGHSVDRLMKACASQSSDGETGKAAA